MQRGESEPMPNSNSIVPKWLSCPAFKIRMKITCPIQQSQNESPARNIRAHGPYNKLDVRYRQTESMRSKSVNNSHTAQRTSIRIRDQLIPHEKTCRSISDVTVSFILFLTR